MLWLALFLPRLPLDALPESAQPSVVVAGEGIVAANDAALAAGVTPGLRLASAYARLPGLFVRPRDPARETAALQRLACWAGAFTSEVSLAPPATVLLEIGASLRLFGGVERLFPQIATEATAQGFAVQAALAPTPLAAEWFARAGEVRPCTDLALLPQRLGALSLAVLLPEQAERLAAFGARTLGDVLRLPRAGLSRRLGLPFAQDLARALGELPDPRARFVFPESFSLRLELPARSDSAPALAFAARRLIGALSGWLAVRAAGVRECVLELCCERGARAAPTVQLALAFAEATRDAQRMARVLDERLARLPLPAAVESMCLRVDAPEAMAGREGQLFSGAAHGVAGNGGGDARVAELIERLQARLGEQRVFRLRAVQDHRPECATHAESPWSETASSRRTVASGPLARTAPSTTMATARPSAPRPLYLLSPPQALPEVGGQPQRGGALHLLTGPERIESGWWDDGEPGATGDVQRDYFIAVSPRDEWLWVFRCVDGWFVHGLFA
ncbi:DNA polymerase Y family protein [Rhodocyclus tenuis]|uniref:DNA polymerase Y family protein n=1 Tax=Rhodocyclus gracilis TaxID=2929842 RepID=A0ABX0WJ53_9RHOO|nr:DNA polymerase Y family protein [Rhodocyclus gracilis]NJA88624.1 DNA polymerase Y family protein [Rhodocyclus gracilis]